MSPLPISSPAPSAARPSAPARVTRDVVHRARHHLRHRRRARWTTAAFGLAFVLVAAACGSSKTTTTAAGSSTTAASGSASATAYRDCLQKHGVTLPAGGFRGGAGGSGTGAGASGAAGATPPNPSTGSAPTGSGGAGAGFRNNPKFAAAQKACASLRPKGSFGGRGGAAGSSAFQAFASCMQSHGIAMGRRPASGSSTTAGSASSTTVDTSSPAYQAALGVCKALLPAGSTGRFGGGSTTSTTAAA